MKKTKSTFTVSVVIPVYNSEKTVIREIKHVLGILLSKKIDFEILISDDQSTDTSYSLLYNHFRQNRNIKLFKQKKNIGISKNIHFLYSNAAKQYTLLYSIDGDWNYHDISKLIDTAKQGMYDIVIGKRKNKNGYTFFRRCITISYNILPRILYRTNTIDAGSIKIFRTSVYKSLILTSTSIFFEAEFIIRALKKSCSMTSVKVRYSKQKRKSQRSVNISMVIDSLKDVLRIMFSL